MKQPITNYLTLIERRNNPIEKFYSRYVLRYFIDTDVFTAVIKKLGGYTYNLSVGKIGNVTIFSGYTWLSVSEVDSYEDGDMWAKKFEEAFFEYRTSAHIYLIFFIHCCISLPFWKSFPFRHVFVQRHASQDFSKSLQSEVSPSQTI